MSRLPLPVFVPHGLHGSFAPGLLFDPNDTARRHKVGTHAIDRICSVGACVYVYMYLHINIFVRMRACAQACLALDKRRWNEMTGGFSGLGIVFDM